MREVLSKRPINLDIRKDTEQTFACSYNRRLQRHKKTMCQITPKRAIALLMLMANANDHNYDIGLIS